jgi:ABC-type transporter Mla maintaining outer membrane lipid asymmetry ATPase subunit MlaF
MSGQTHRAHIAVDGREIEKVMAIQFHQPSLIMGFLFAASRALFSRLQVVDLILLSNREQRRAFVVGCGPGTD